MQATSTLFRVTLLGILLVVISCTRQPGDLHPLTSSELTLETARAWFNQQALHPSSSARVEANRFANLSPNWNKAYEGKTPKGEKFIEVPLESPQKRNWVYSQNGNSVSAPSNNLSLVVFINDGQTTGTIKEISLDDDFAVKNSGKFRKGHFTGKIFTWSWSGEFLGGSYYKDGKKEAALTSVSDKNPNARRLYCVVTTTCYWSSYCTDSGLWGTSTTSSSSQCFPPTYGHGSSDEYYCSAWQYNGQSSYQQCYDDTTPGPGEGTGPDGPPENGPESYSVDINISNLENPCMVSTYNALLNAQIKTKILSIVWSFHQSKDMTIDLIDKDLNDNTVDGTTRVTNAQYNAYEIALNTGALANASKDYIAATIIHEMLHVYLPGNDGDTDHEKMAEMYVKPMANAIVAAGFIVTYNDAVDLAWGGLQKTKAWRELQDIDRVSGTNVTGRIIQTNNNYRNNPGYGNRCN